MVAGILLGWILNGTLGRFLMGSSEQPWIWMVSVFYWLSSCLSLMAAIRRFGKRKSHRTSRGGSLPCGVSSRKLPSHLDGLVRLDGRCNFDRHFYRWTDGDTHIGGLVGSGPGAGMSLMIAMSGILVAAVGITGTFFKAIRNVEIDLPDYDA